jgi:hypothetical protein
MSAEPTPQNQSENVPFPTTPPGETGHSGTSEDDFEFFTLTDQQFRAIELTVKGNSDISIAQELDIDRKTLWRWRTFNDQYRTVLSNSRIERRANTIDRYQVLLDKATSILIQFLSDPNDKTRLRAANAILNMAGCFQPLNPTHFPISRPEPVLPPKVG